MMPHDMALFASQIVTKVGDRLPIPTMVPATVIFYDTDALTGVVALDGDDGDQTSVINVTGLTFVPDDRVMVSFFPPQGVFITGLINSNGWIGYRPTLMDKVLLPTKSSGFTPGSYALYGNDPQITISQPAYPCNILAFATCSIFPLLTSVTSLFRLQVMVSTDGGTNYGTGAASYGTSTSNSLVASIATTMYSPWQNTIVPSGDIKIKAQIRQDTGSDGDHEALSGHLGYFIQPALA